METRNSRQKYEGGLKERNLQAVRKYYLSHKFEVLRRLVLSRIEKGHQPKVSTLQKYGLLKN
jgi:hypothetical protein